MSVGYEPVGSISLDGRVIDAANHPELLFAGKIAAFCANARVMYSEEDKRFRITGDPTEAAMLVLSQKLGFHKEDLERESAVLGEIPFDYRLKYHTMLHAADGKNFLTAVGAPEVILELSETVWLNGKRKEMSPADLNRPVFIKCHGTDCCAAIDPDFGKILPENIKSCFVIHGMRDDKTGSGIT